MESKLLVKKLETLESGLNELKGLIGPNSKEKIVSIKGSWKGLKTTESDFEKAKKSLFWSSR